LSKNRKVNADSDEADYVAEDKSDAGMTDSFYFNSSCGNGIYFYFIDKL